MKLQHLGVAAGVLGLVGAVYYFATRKDSAMGAIAMNPGHMGALAMNPGHYGAIQFNGAHDMGAIAMSGAHLNGAHDLGAVHTAGFGSVELSGHGAGAAF